MSAIRKLDVNDYLFRGVKVGGQEGGVFSWTFGGMDADGERTGMCLQRVQEKTPPSRPITTKEFRRASPTLLK